jgi:hypothetical protein
MFTFYWRELSTITLAVKRRDQKEVYFKSEDVMQQRSPSRAWFHSLKGLHKRGAKTVEPSVTVVAPAESVTACVRNLDGQLMIRY